MRFPLTYQRPVREHASGQCESMPGAMGFNRRKMEDRRRQAADKEAAARRATNAKVLEDAERLIEAWNERQARRMPMLFSPTIGAAIAARYWFLWVRCPACRTINAVDLRVKDRHGSAAVTSLVPALSAARVDQMRRSPNSCGSQGAASPAKCARSTDDGCWASRGVSAIPPKVYFVSGGSGGNASLAF